MDFGDGTVGQGLDVAAEWYFVRVHDVAAPPSPVHVPFADFDGDSDVDLGDFGVLQRCLTGPGGGIPSGCEAFDRPEAGFPAGDSDIDASDVDKFLACFSGPDIPASASCETPVANAAQDYLSLYCALRSNATDTDALITQAKSHGIGTLVPSLSGSSGSVAFVTPKENYLPELAGATCPGV